MDDTRQEGRGMYKEEQDLLSHYNSNPEYYSPINSHDGVDRMRRIFGLNPDIQYSVLDVGCGDGRLAKYWPSAVVTGVDYSPVRIELAQQNPGTWICSDVYDFVEFTDGTWDLGVAVEVLEHLKEPGRLIQSMRFVCNRIVGTVPVNMPYYAHLSVFETEQAVKDKLNPDTIVKDGGHFYCSWKGLI